jgi:hypothetical protein
MNIFYRWEKDMLSIKIEDIAYDSDVWDSEEYFFQINYENYTLLEKNSVCIKTFDRLI